MTFPQTIDAAWKWKQFAEFIDAITPNRFEELQDRAVMLGKELHKITAKGCRKQCVYHLMFASERNLSMRQALMGWKLTVKKIGKEPVNIAPALKKQARELMAECQTAVMPGL